MEITVMIKISLIRISLSIYLSNHLDEASRQPLVLPFTRKRNQYLCDGRWTGYIEKPFKRLNMIWI